MPAIVSIIDDDPAVLDAVGLLLRAKGFAVACHADCRTFLNAPAAPGCIISDVRMPGMNGLDLLRLLRGIDDVRPMILLTGHGDIEMAVQAIRQGAFDFLEKPFRHERLLGSVRSALAASERLASEHTELAAMRSRYDALTERQKQTMRLLVDGLTNKDIAARLDISSRTVEIYRAVVMVKMDAKSLAQLVRISLRLEQHHADAPPSAHERPSHTR